MSTFMLLSFAMLAVACAVVIAPLIGGRPTPPDAPDGQTTEPVATHSVIAIVIALPLGALALYGYLSDGVPDAAALARPAAQPGGDLPSVAEMVTALEQRLAAQPDDRTGWQMLGRSYGAMRRYPDAVAAYQRALALSGDRPAALLVETAEAMMLADQGSLAMAAGELVEEALRREPGNRKALWYGGNAAFERGDYRAARDRWQALASDAPPPALVDVLNQRIAAASQQLGEPVESAAVTAAAPMEGPTETPTEAPTETPTGAVAVAVSIAPGLASDVAPVCALFVLARSTAGGPPLAVVRRQAGELPLEVTLSDANAMIAGRTISSETSVQIVARIALGGGPVASPGDLFGSVNYNVADGDGVRIVIDRVQP